MVPLCGSILIVFKHRGLTGDYKLFRVSFHTAFIGSSNHMKVTRNQISPENNHKDFKTFPEGFEVNFFFKDHSNPMEVEDMQKEVGQWENISKILSKYPGNRPSQADCQDICPGP